MSEFAPFKVLTVLAASLVMSACATTATTSQESPKVSAPVENVVRITSQSIPHPPPAEEPRSADAPSRIVTLAMGSGETIAALGAGTRLVGRDEASSGPLIDRVPVVTSGHSVSAESVIALEPDLVIVDAGTSPPEAVDQLRAAGIRVATVPQAWSVDDVPARIRAIADAVKAAPGSASAVITASLGSSTRPRDSGTERPRVAFLYLRGTAAVYLLGGTGSGADDLIRRAGATDVGAELGLAAFTPLTAEALAAADPDALLVMSDGLESVGGLEGLRQLPGVAQTQAGRETRIIAVDDTLLLSFGPRTSALVDALARALRTMP